MAAEGTTPATLALPTKDDEWLDKAEVLERSSGRVFEGQAKMSINVKEYLQSMAIVPTIATSLRPDPQEALNITSIVIQGEVFGDASQLGLVREGEVTSKDSYQFPSSAPSTLTWHPLVRGLTGYSHVHKGSCSQIPLYEEFMVLMTYEIDARFTQDKDGKPLGEPRTLSVRLEDPTEVLVTTLCWTVVNRRNTKNVVANPALRSSIYAQALSVVKALNIWVAKNPTIFNEQVANVLQKNDHQPFTPVSAREEQVATLDLGGGLRVTWVAH